MGTGAEGVDGAEGVVVVRGGGEACGGGDDTVVAKVRARDPCARWPCKS